MSKKEPMDTFLGVALPASLMEALDQAAEEREETRSDLVRSVLARNPAVKKYLTGVVRTTRKDNA